MEILSSAPAPSCPQASMPSVSVCWNSPQLCAQSRQPRALRGSEWSLPLQKDPSGVPILSSRARTHVVRHLGLRVTYLCPFLSAHTQRPHRAAHRNALTLPSARVPPETSLPSIVLARRLWVQSKSVFVECVTGRLLCVLAPSLHNASACLPLGGLCSDGEVCFKTHLRCSVTSVFHIS